jgi:hypothetical protein
LLQVCQTIFIDKAFYKVNFLKLVASAEVVLQF